MNIANNMEAIFVAALALAGMSGIATASRPVTTESSVQSGKVQAVTISASRLTLAEKAAAQ
ncbi:hypothetical protein KY495_16700 [Massilia sp. PAMC28688]|uniref:hypothetical protein n=1 Tax=Massilia sp. PAMC28688 TaxID=2861283 RepID=UPI001C63B14A|nr:hypothetical protein [Massilia sp. PAMC28688]QYF92383.1 hypothetical protein KY495_16700 [Massilia sp. PAMC28688]